MKGAGCQPPSSCAPLRAVRIGDAAELKEGKERAQEAGELKRLWEKREITCTECCKLLHFCF